MMRKQPVALLLNDIHVDNSNIPEFQSNWDEALSICKDHNICDIIIGGDLWLSRSAQALDVLMAVRHAILKAVNQDMYITIAEGNHCKVNQESILGYSHIFSEYPNVDVVDSYSAIDIGKDAVLYVMSYFPENGSFTHRLDELIKNDFEKSKYNVLYIHEGIKGGLAQPSDNELPTNIFKCFDKVLVGHYHDRKTIPNTNIEYIGASRQHNFGEDEEKGYTILFDDGSCEFVKNQANIRYKTLSISVNDLNDKNISSKLIHEGQNDTYKIRLCIHCDSTQTSIIDKKKLIEFGCTKVEVITNDANPQTSTNLSLEHKYDKSGIKTEYELFCADKGIKNVEIGLQYLDKIN